MLTEHGIPISPSTYYEWVGRRPLARALEGSASPSSSELNGARSRLVANLGSLKMWPRLRGQGHDVARCTIERLFYRAMPTAGKAPSTGAHSGDTIKDERAQRAAGLVNRVFEPGAPERLWVANLERDEALLTFAVV